MSTNHMRIEQKNQAGEVTDIREFTESTAHSICGLIDAAATHIVAMLQPDWQEITIKITRNRSL